jgi:hypothetical protein
VVPEQHRGVGQVLGGDLGHLQLGEQQFGGRQRPRFGLEPGAEVQRVRHLEGVQEHVHVPAAVAVVEQPPRPVAGVEEPLRLVPQFLQQGAQRPGLPPVRHQVEVRVGATEGGPRGRGSAQPDRHPAEQPDLDRPLGGRGHQGAPGRHHRRLSSHPKKFEKNLTNEVGIRDTHTQSPLDTNMIIMQ